MINNNYKHSNLTARIIRCANTVHTTLKSGYPEKIYQKALALELKAEGLMFDEGISIPVYYHNVKIGTRIVNFLVEEIICIEIKAQSVLENRHLAQTFRYLDSFNLEVGLLINFGESSLNYKRLSNNNYRKLNL